MVPLAKCPEMGNQYCRKATKGVKLSVTKSISFMELNVLERRNRNG